MKEMTGTGNNNMKCKAPQEATDRKTLQRKKAPLQEL
jgi:hypothetical protein